MSRTTSRKAYPMLQAHAAPTRGLPPPDRRPLLLPLRASAQATRTRPRHQGVASFARTPHNEGLKAPAKTAARAPQADVSLARTETSLGGKSADAVGRRGLIGRLQGALGSTRANSWRVSRSKTLRSSSHSSRPSARGGVGFSGNYVRGADPETVGAEDRRPGAQGGIPFGTAGTPLARAQLSRAPPDQYLGRAELYVQRPGAIANIPVNGAWT